MPEAVADISTPRKPADVAWYRRARRLVDDRVAEPVDMLPFVAPGDIAVRSFWSPRPTGDYVFDCSLGQRYGEALLPLLRGAAGRHVLRKVVLDMVAQGDAARDRGLIVGMMGVLGDALAGGAP